MFKRSARLAMLAPVAGILLLSACATQPHTQQVNVGVVSDSPPPATPQINRAAAQRLTSSAVHHDSGAVALGAGDRFGHQMYVNYMLAVRMHEQDRMLAEVP